MHHMLHLLRCALRARRCEYLQSRGVMSGVGYGEILMKNASSHQTWHLEGAVSESVVTAFRPYRALNMMDVKLSNPWESCEMRRSRVWVDDMRI